MVALMKKKVGIIIFYKKYLYELLENGYNEL